LAALGADVRIAGYGIFEGNSVGVAAERDDTTWSVGPALSVPLPLFDWGQARRDRAAALVVEARHQLTKTKRQIVEEVRKAYGTFRSSTDALERVRGELVPLQEQRREQAEAAYKAGQTDVTALLLAEQDLQAARARLIELQRRTSAAQIGLQRAVGGPREADRLTSPENPSTKPVSTAPAAQTGTPASATAPVTQPVP
jgi:outer membrane protein TolC